MKIKVIYITSSSYSGSTILGFLLGSSVSVFNCGELKYFFKEGFNEPCSCGRSFEECDFWMKIREKCKHIKDVFGLKEWDFSRLTNSISGLIDYELFKSIYEEISKTDDVKYILDVSKMRVSPLSGQETGSFKVHSVPALNDFIVSIYLSKKRSSESLYIQRSLSYTCSYLNAKMAFCAGGNP